MQRGVNDECNWALSALVEPGFRLNSRSTVPRIGVVTSRLDPDGTLGVPSLSHSSVRLDVVTLCGRAASTTRMSSPAL